MRSAACVLVPCVLLAAGCPSLQSYHRAHGDVAEAVDVPYIDDGDRKHRLDLYHPRSAGARWPVVVFIHGGHWRSGDKRYWQAVTGLYGNVGVALAERGVGAVVANYRLHPRASLEQMLDDVVAAMTWARAHVADRGGDPNQLVLAGHSAGGHLAALLGARPELLAARGFDPAWLKGVVGISGIYDIGSTLELASDELRTQVLIPLFSTDAEAQKRASPLRWFGERMTPVLLLVGSRDYRSCARDFDAAEQLLAPRVGTTAWLHRIDGNTHEDMVLEIGTPRDEVAPRIASFVHALGRLPTPTTPPTVR